MSPLPTSLPCPFCNSKAALTIERRSYEVPKGSTLYKEGTHRIQHYIYKCNSCGEKFTTTESDEMTLNHLLK